MTTPTLDALRALLNDTVLRTAIDAVSFLEDGDRIVRLTPSSLDKMRAVLSAALASASARQEVARDDDLGLSIDMLDADRLREWARLLLLHGPDISHWGSVPYVAGKMQTIATGIEKAVRDIGTLRVAPPRAPETPQTCATCKHLKTDRDFTGEARSWCPVAKLDVTDTPEGFGCTLHEPAPPPPSESR